MPSRTDPLQPTRAHASCQAWSSTCLESLAGIFQNPGPKNPNSERKAVLAWQLGLRLCRFGSAKLLRTGF